MNDAGSVERVKPLAHVLHDQDFRLVVDDGDDGAKAIGSRPKATIATFTPSTFGVGLSDEAERHSISELGALRWKKDWLRKQNAKTTACAVAMEFSPSSEAKQFSLRNLTSKARADD